MTAASGLSAATPMLVYALKLNPFYALAAGSLSTAATARLIGESAIRYYSQPVQQGGLAVAEA